MTRIRGSRRREPPVLRHRDVARREGDPTTWREVLRLVPDVVRLLDRCTLVITDSGGLQEEAPALGKPVLVCRSTTERPEAVEAGTVKLVGTDPGLLAQELSRLLGDRDYYHSMSRNHNPYGDGLAAQRIADVMRDQHYSAVDSLVLNAAAG